MILNPFDDLVTRDGWSLVLGPPGTGKTTSILRTLERELGAGLAPENIAVVTFTRAARAEAMARAARQLKVEPSDFTWIRTIHSTAFRLLGLDHDHTLTRSDWAAFAKRYSYQLTQFRVVRDDDDEPDYSVDSPDDAMAAALGWGRSRCLDLDTTLARAPYPLEAPRFELFADRYTKFREEIEKYDFHDMLERAVPSPMRPPVRVAFIDEAQDLSPLQVRLVERWFEECERVYVAGDDDQAIYRFMGGDPDWLIRLSHQCPSVQILEQSFRVPIYIHATAQRVIRHNHNRVPKEYWPRPDPGELQLAEREELPHILNDHTFVLARNWYLLRPIARILADSGVPFMVEKHASWSPLGHPAMVSAAQTAVAIFENRPVHAKPFAAFIKLIPTRTKKSPQGVPRGIKKEADENEGRVTRDVMRAWGLQDLLDAMDEHGPVSVMTRMKEDVRVALDRLYKRHGKILSQPQTHLLTIHASKGREADTVVLVSDMSRKSYAAYAEGDEAEHRVAYVGITRAKKRLVVLQPTTKRFYPFPSAVRAVLKEPPQLREPGDDDPDIRGYV